MNHAVIWSRGSCSVKQWRLSDLFSTSPSCVSAHTHCMMLLSHSFPQRWVVRLIHGFFDISTRVQVRKYAITSSLLPSTALFLQSNFVPWVKRHLYYGVNVMRSRTCSSSRCESVHWWKLVILPPWWDICRTIFRTICFRTRQIKYSAGILYIFLIVKNRLLFHISSQMTILTSHRDARPKVAWGGGGWTWPRIFRHTITIVFLSRK